ncbi:M81 family metallopeptidase [Actinokineospora iranica]|uniref:Microcystin degradation protein MlrC, contains DUF1485 domain n=1 Tax=Actinokineospora iranica TaxID=1271860 RepID=A0A1G6QXA0_9PSEU|nr:M81 family metallopeptidase [Actinokineospora iranica]SDC96902.1 Microcystin degradation protein MlrC, contains DUF1485 domain [Actinokineospora iranica]
MRALIAGIVHESSTLMVEYVGPTRLADFDVHTGAALTAQFAGTNTCVGGYLAACARLGVEPVPALHARAEPGAALDPAACAELVDRLVARATAAGPVDVVLLDLHGAGALVSGESVDLAVLRAVRAVVGPDVPVAATLDLHGNIPAELPDLAETVVGFLEYPHTDMGERAERAAEIAVSQARGRTRPVTRVLSLPMLVPPSDTGSGQARLARDLARAAQDSADVLACTVFHGFPYADTPQAATSVVTVVDGDPAAADAVNRRIGDWLWDNRDGFRIATLTPAEAVALARANEAHPVVIGDGTDNPGCGAPADSTHLLRALLDSGASACYAALHDPDTVAAAVAARVGGRLTVALGGRHGWASGPPVTATATVRAITDGHVVHQAMRRGKALEFGRSVRLAVGKVDVVVSSKRSQVFDPEILLLHGIQPDRYEIVAVKSVNHFRAGFAGIAARLLVADAPGPLSRDIASVPRGGPTAARWPMDAAAVYRPLSEISVSEKERTR